MMADRRRFLAGAAGLGALGLLEGCATSPLGGLGRFAAPSPLAPVDARPNRIAHVTVCLRPFRAEGPRLDVETVGDKLVVHNYGHGGSGWSLSWGSSTLAVKKALAGGAREVAVIGCGALGLTSATLAQQAGARVTIYAKEPPALTRSARATGVWSPDSRIALERAAAPGFGALWEEMTRTSYRAFNSLVGIDGDPVSWTDRYGLHDIPPAEARALRHHEDPIGFAAYGDRVRDLTPRGENVPSGEHPFPTKYVTRTPTLRFNVAELAHRLMSDFLLAGGRFERMELQSPGQIAQFREPVVINCPGYGARALWKDESIVPVRGQIAWLIPQDEVRYGVSYRNVTMLARHDGIVIQQTGPNEGWGYADANEAVDRTEAETAVATIAELYSRLRSA